MHRLAPIRLIVSVAGVLALSASASTAFAQTPPVDRSQTAQPVDRSQTAQPVDRSQTAQPVDRSKTSGEDIYRSACVSCHGRDGRGQPKSVVGFDTPLPDFTQCSFTTPEADGDWSAVIHKGGTIRALDHRMPAFVDALSESDIQRTIDYVRGFCTERGWPRGDLNFPRVFFTEKAFPENEAVLTTTIGSHASGGVENVENAFLFEHRIGRRAQYEVNVPLAVQAREDGTWAHGLGDVNVALKYALFDSFRHGFILSAGGEVTLPTGKENEGLGGGTTIFEGFGMFGKSLPSDGFLQFHAGFEAPANGDVKEAYWRTGVGKTFFANHRWGRQWSPMFEVLGAKELESGADPEWDVVPQLQVSLSGLQHVLVAAGVRIPVNERASRGNAVVMYFLWDWFDGGLFSNWK